MMNHHLDLKRNHNGTNSLKIKLWWASIDFVYLVVENSCSRMRVVSEMVHLTLIPLIENRNFYPETVKVYSKFEDFIVLAIKLYANYDWIEKEI